MVTHFAQKGVTHFFKSETYFLEQIGHEINTVLDIGCASGRFTELLRDITPTFKYTGVDLSSDNIESARRLYPEYRFHDVQALDFSTTERFDLVNATGVCQHEPRFEELIEKMIGWSRRYVLFDVKLAAIREHLVDIDVAYYRFEHPLYLILLSLNQFISFLRAHESIAKISVFGYVTPKNSVTVVPETIGDLVSAGVLLEMGRPVGDGAFPYVQIELPQWLVHKDTDEG